MYSNNNKANFSTKRQSSCIVKDERWKRYVYSNNNKANFSTKRRSGYMVRDESIGNIMYTTTTIRQISLHRDNKVLM